MKVSELFTILYFSMGALNGKRTIADTRNGIIVIDEIDNGLHYSSQTILLKALLKAAKEYDVQIFATTHNYETLIKLRDVLEDDEMSQFKEEVSTFTLRKTSENILKSYLYDFEKLNHALTQEIEIR